jgi:CRP/FNR family transcriptional regulator, cyclic AMP receptor protein
MPGTKISPELLKELSAASKPVSKKDGALLFQAGTSARGVYLVRKGRIQLHLEGAGALYPTRILRAGAILGLPATVSGEAYSLTAIAIEDCDLDFVPRRELLALLQRNTTAALQILRILSEEIYQMRNTAKKAYPAQQETVH